MGDAAWLSTLARRPLLLQAVEAPGHVGGVAHDLAGTGMGAYGAGANAQCWDHRQSNGQNDRGG